MRINAKTPTWRIVIHALVKFGTAACFIYAVATENWQLVAFTGAVMVLGAIEGGRDQILDHLDAVDRKASKGPRGTRAEHAAASSVFVTLGATDGAQGPQIGSMGLPTYEGECPRCHKWKFIGHGPLCTDCYCASEGGDR